MPLLKDVGGVLAAGEGMSPSASGLLPTKSSGLRQAAIAVQRWIDTGGLAGRVTSTDGLLEVHKRFCELLPSALLKVKDPASGETLGVIPGEIRTRDVEVGRHLAISPGAVRRFS